MNQKIMIYGAGAIGRGFLAPIFSSLGYNIFFVDINSNLINELKKRNCYKTAFIENGKYKILNVKYAGAFMLGEEDEILDSVDFVFSCVGPNNVDIFAKKLKNIPNIISFENDINTREIIKNLSGNENSYFGIPDVITSNMCCDSLKKIDPLCLISEIGDIAIEKCCFRESKKIKTYSRKELEKYWNCKFYLHNTAHAVAAFLGKIYRIDYIHEAMSIKRIRDVVESVMNSMKNTMKIKGMADSDYIDFYAEKEIRRFENKLLFDPISRVGRDPLRKLRGHDRLISSARIMIEANQNTDGIILTIKAAMLDAIKNYTFETYDILKEVPNEIAILKKISGLEETESLFQRIVGLNYINSNQVLFEPLLSLMEAI